jgi:copper chaperone NosL
MIAAAASLALILAFFLPLWRITLEAPQYPEGLGLNIGVSTIEGAKRNDLQNINGLNHYIGMARIEPQSIPELRLMPWVLGGLIAMGLATAITGRRAVLVSWATVFGVAAVVGLVDFYRWEYNYGHNLDPTAAIKVPGLTYQPPLIGSTKLLNFTAHSWPGAGGWILIGAFITTVALVLYTFRRGRVGAVAVSPAKDVAARPSTFPASRPAHAVRQVRS